MSEFDATSTADEVLANINLQDRLVVLTGATAGIGVATAQALTKAGANLVIGARNQQKLDELLDQLRSTNPPGTVRGFALDLLSFTSIDSFASSVLSLERPVDILINNAGIIGQLKRSAEGIESQLMTNFIGHATLTSRLIESMKQSAAPRVVCLTSFGHHYSSVVLEDLNFENRPYSAWLAYGQSKTACVLLAVHLSNVTDIDAFAVHPGAIWTDLGNDLIEEDIELATHRGSVPNPDDFKTPEQGAATTVWAATASELVGRGPIYLEDCSIAEIREEPNYQSGVMSYALDPKLAADLWHRTESLIGRELPLS